MFSPLHIIAQIARIPKLVENGKKKMKKNINLLINWDDNREKGARKVRDK